MRNVVRATAAFLFFITLLPAPSVSAQGTLIYPEASPSMVLETTRVFLWQLGNEAGYTESFDWLGNFTFKLSPQDPNQVTGAFAYNVSVWGGPLAIGGADCAPCILTTNTSRSAVPDRAGWVWTTLSLNGVGNGTFNLTLNANNTGTVAALDTHQSGSACEVGMWVNFRLEAGHYQCGDNIAAPPGVSVLTTREATSAGLPALSEFRWKLSTDDPDQTNGDFEYWLYQGPVLETVTNYTGMVPTLASAGILKFTIETGAAPGSTFPLYGAVLARDPLTHQRSEFSCTVFAQGGTLYEGSGCGLLGVPGAGIVDGQISFPMTNVSQIATASGMSEEAVGAFLGVGTVVGFSMMGFVGAGIVGGALAGIGSLVFLAALNIMPMYVTVVLVLAGVSVIVFRMRGGSE